MPHKMTQGDRNCVSNLRLQYKEKLAAYSDEVIAIAWRQFSQSDEYPDDDVRNAFVEWCQMEFEAQQ